METKWARVHTYGWYLCSVAVRNVRAVCWLHTEQLALLLAAVQLKCDAMLVARPHTYCPMAVCTTAETDCWLYHVCPSVSHTCPTAGRTFLKSDKGFVIRSVESIQVWLKSVRNKTNLREYLRTFQYLIIDGFHNWDSVLCEVRAVQLVIEHRPWSIAHVEISMFQMRV